MARARTGNRPWPRRGARRHAPLPRPGAAPWRAGRTTPSSDVHALAAVLYEMLAGRPAYPAATPVALAEATHGAVDPIPSIPPALDARGPPRRSLPIRPIARPTRRPSRRRTLRALAADRRGPPMAAPSLPPRCAARLGRAPGRSPAPAPPRAAAQASIDGPPARGPPAAGPSWTPAPRPAAAANGHPTPAARLPAPVPVAARSASRRRGRARRRTRIRARPSTGASGTAPAAPAPVAATRRPRRRPQPKASERTTTRVAARARAATGRARARTTDARPAARVGRSRPRDPPRKLVARRDWARRAGRRCGSSRTVRPWLVPVANGRRGVSTAPLDDGFPLRARFGHRVFSLFGVAFGTRSPSPAASAWPGSIRAA